MPSYPMKFCRVGHEIAITGRTKWGACTACYKIRFPGGEALRNGICIRGHDTKIHGRNKSRECNICRSETNKRHAWKGFLKQDGSQFTTTDYNRLYQIQGGCCAMCKRHQLDIKKTLEVDHDHNTMIVRGLLCSGCNMHLGKYEQIKESAEIYLSKALRLDATATDSDCNERANGTPTQSFIGKVAPSTEGISQ